MLDPELDLDILRLFQSHEYYMRYNYNIDRNNLARETTTILQGYDSYYKQHSDNIVFSTFVPYFFNTLHANWMNDDIVYYKHIFSRLTNIKVPDLKPTLVKLQQEELWSQIETAKNNAFDVIKMRDLLSSYIDKEQDDEHDYVCNDDSFLFANSERSEGIRFRLKKLNEILNPLIKGDFGAIFAYTNTGKTLFMISELAHMAQQIKGDGKVLYFNNEGSEDRLLRAIWCSVLQAPFDMIKKHKERAVKAFTKKMHGDKERILLFDTYGKDTSYIEHQCTKYNPKLIIIDQLDNLLSARAKESCKAYGSLYEWARNLSKKYCPVLGATQASGAVTWTDKDGNQVYKKYLEQSDMYDSRVAKQGAMEFCIGLSIDPLFPNKRYISVPRSKLPGKWHEGIRNFDCNMNRNTYTLEN